MLKGLCRTGSARGALVALYHGLCHAHARHFRSELPVLFWRAFRIAVAFGRASAAPECHLLCQKCHPLRHYDTNSKKPGFKRVFDIQPISFNRFRFQPICPSLSRKRLQRGKGLFLGIPSRIWMANVSLMMLHNAPEQLQLS
jgi:hypothetical protein